MLPSLDQWPAILIIVGADRLNYLELTLESVRIFLGDWPLGKWPGASCAQAMGGC